MNKNCPKCGHKIPLLSPEEFKCAGCGVELTSKDNNIAFAAICVIGFLPAKAILAMSFTLGTFLQAVGVLLGLWGLYIALNHSLTTYTIKESAQSND